MTSLSEVYEGGINTVADPRQRRLGMALFGVGVLLVVGSISIATTSLAGYLGLDVYAARELAGILAGLGIPAVFVGIFVVLPASDTARATAAIGASLATFGVVLFGYAYPDRWLAADPPVALATTAIYSLGTLITVWCLFISVATFDPRNAPGGSARVEVTKAGNIRVISTSQDGNGGGSVGLFGTEPDGEIPTQTNDTRADGGSNDMPKPTSDGGSAVADDALVDDEILEAAKERGKPDRYCGNCMQFRYVRVDGKITPYCALDERLMEDMDACDEWEENN